MDDMIKQILDAVTDIKVEQAKQGKDIAQNTKDLSTHIEGVKQCQTRLDTLEKPAIALNTIKKWALYISAIAGAIVVVHKLYKL